MQMQFQGGLVTNEAYHRGRSVSAAFVRNCRVNENGWLIPRKGRVQADAPDVFSYEETYGGAALAKMDAGTIAYDETPASHRTLSFVFQAVKTDSTQVTLPTEQGDTETPLPILAPKTNIGEKSDPVEVETLRVMGNSDDFGEYEEGLRANIHHPEVFFDSSTETIAIRFRIVGDITLSVRILDFESRRVLRTIRSEHRYLDGGASDHDDLFSFQDFPRYKRVDWDGLDNVGAVVPPGTYWVEFLEQRPVRRLNLDTDDIDDYLPVTDYSYLASYLDFEMQWTAPTVTVGNVEGADYVDVYSTHGGRDGGYYWIARMPVDGTMTYKFPIPDPNTSQVLDFETPDWEYIAVNEFRAYVAEENSNRIYLSYFNPGTGERLYRQFTDFIDLDLNGGYITGLHFLRDTHLVVYASNQIQILSTDPIPALHAVIDFIKPRDEKGEFIGCISPQSIVDLGGIHYFLATDKRIYAFDGAQLREKSDKVHGVLQTISQLQNVVGFSYDRHYMLSVSTETDGDPNTTLVYDTIHNVWWQDDFGVADAMKDAAGNVYGVINGQTYQLYVGETDAGQPIRRTWRSHPFYGKLSQWWESVHVSPQDPAVIDVEAYTEQDRVEGQLDIESVRDVFAQRMGMSLWGRTLTVEIQTESAAAIDRIAINEQIRM